MALLDRYKKKGGFAQLLILLESSSPPKREKFLSMIKEESPAWESALREKIMTLERISNWDPNALMESLSRIQPLTIATAIYNHPQSKKSIFLNALAYKERRQVEQLLSDRKPSESEVMTCELRIVSEVRGMFSSGVLKYDKIDSGLAFDENIEVNLNTTFTAPPQYTSEQPPIPEVEQLRRKVKELTEENRRLKEMLASQKKIA